MGEVSGRSNIMCDVDEGSTVTGMQFSSSMTLNAGRITIRRCHQFEHILSVNANDCIISQRYIDVNTTSAVTLSTNTSGMQFDYS